MKKGLAFAALAAMTALGLALIVTLPREAVAQPSAQASGADVVMMRCESRSQGFFVTSYQGSTAAPSKKTDNCPQTLSDLQGDGFTIRHIGYSQEADFYVFTLAR